MKLSRLLAAATLFAVCAPPSTAFAESAPASVTVHPDSVKPDVSTIRATPTYELATVSEVRAVDTPLLNKLAPLIILPFLFAGSVKTIVADQDGYPALTSADRRQMNNLITDFYYWTQNRIIAATGATYPLCATATVTSKVKTTNATVLICNGVVVALGATDNYWTLTGANLVTGKTRKYMLLSDAAGVATVIASDDQAAAADCRFTQRPANGTVIVGILQVTNASGADFIPATTLLGAAGITATYLDGSTDLPFSSKVVLPPT